MQNQRYDENGLEVQEAQEKARRVQMNALLKDVKTMNSKIDKVLENEQCKTPSQQNNEQSFSLQQLKKNKTGCLKQGV